MLRWIHNTGRIFFRAGHNLVHNDGVELAGYLTFLAMLAVFPFLVILVAIAGYLGQGDAGAHSIGLLLSSLPDDAIHAIRPRIDEIISGPPEGLLTVSILGAIWTSSSGVEGMRTVLNRAYRVSEPPTYLVRRLLSMVQVTVFGMMLIIFMLGLLLSPMVMDYFARASGVAIPPAWQHFVEREFVYIGAALVFFGVASLYFVLPNIKQSMLAVLPGAALCVALWVLGAKGVTYYLDHVSQVNLIYGSLSGFIATLLFFFVMGVMFIYGAEFNSQLVEVLRIRTEEREHATASTENAVIKKMQ